MSNLDTFSTSDVTLETSPIILRNGDQTRLVFIPKWVSVSENQLRGGFRFQRKSPKDTWEDVDAKPLSSLKKDEGYVLNIDGDELAILFSELENIKSLLEKYGHAYGTRQFVIEENNANQILLQIGDVENREWVISQLKVLESEQFENLSFAIGRAKLEKAIEFITNHLYNDDEGLWQDYFQQNPWLLQQLFPYPVLYLNGETYLGGKNCDGRQGFGGVATDFLVMNLCNDSFGVIEIKTPMCNLVGKQYRGKNNSDGSNTIYEIHGDISGGIVQLENQIFIALSNFRNQLNESFPELDSIDPVGILIAGNTHTLDTFQKKSLNLFRKSLGKNKLVTYNEILAKLKNIKQLYDK